MQNYSKNNGDDESRIEEMKKRLYSRGARGISRKRRRLHGSETNVTRGWKGAQLPKQEYSSLPRPKKKSILPILLAASAVFFVAAIVVSLILFYSGSDVSPRNVNIVVQGPATIGGGEEMTLQISITNKNAVAIETADLIVEFPDGTRSASDLSIELPRIRESIGTLEPGERVQKTVRSVLFGPEQSRQNMKISVEYRVKGSNAIFFADQEYQVTLATSPITLSVQSLKDVISGQEVAFTIDVTSNSGTVIKDALLTVEYPFGFEFLSASPQPSFTESVWELGDLQPEGKRRVTIRGTVSGEDGEERVLRFASGIQSKSDETQLVTAFVSHLQSVFIKKPFMSVTMALDGDTEPTYIARSGRKIRGDITWSNNLPVQVTDAELFVRITGSALDKQSVSVDSGFYRSIDDTVFWNKDTKRDLAFINPGDTGRVSFSFSPFDLPSGRLPTNPEIFLDVSIKGRRISDSNVPEEVESSIQKTVRIASDVLFTPRIVHFAGPFQNNGPMPPQAEKETTYTVIWTVTNTLNRLSDTRVVATLPSYVRWMNVVSPSQEDISFNPIGGQITWNIDDIAPGGGSFGSQREVAFQIALLPSISQVGDTPVLINEQTVTGFDQFTETEVSAMKRELNTRLSTDTGFVNNYERVIE